MLSKNAKKIINNYLSLPFKNKGGVQCPYFNNARSKQRGQLRSLVGKGTPKEIIEEVEILTKQYGINLENLNTEEIKKFLVEHNLGIECSGFITNVLQQHYLEKDKINLIKKIFIPTKNFFRKIIVSFRKIENINVKALANPKNSILVKDWKKVQAGDLIIMLQTGPNNTRDHIILITGNELSIIKYVHARQWSSEGKYHHGVQTGEIKVTNPQKNLLNQTWTEKEKQGENNETFMEAKNAKILEIRRIKIN